MLLDYNQASYTEHVKNITVTHKSSFTPSSIDIVNSDCFEMLGIGPVDFRRDATEVFFDKMSQKSEHSFTFTTSSVTLSGCLRHAPN